MVVPDYAADGGLPTLSRFVYRVIRDSGRYDVDVVSVPMSSRDPESVRLLSPGSWAGGPKIREGAWRGVPYRHVGSSLAEFEFQRYRPRRALTALLAGYDLIHVAAGTPAWALLAGGLRRPVVLHVASLARSERVPLLSQSRGAKGLVRRMMTRVTCRLDSAGIRRSDFIFVINNWMLEYLAAEFPASRAALGVPGVDTGVFRPSGGPPRDYVLAVGRYHDPRKNAPLLFRAYRGLRDRMPGAPRLVIASPDPIGDANWEVARSLGVAEYTDVRLGTTVEELAELYRDASAYLLSSDEEGLGIVLLESMASGVPVVSTKCGGPETVVDDGVTGFLTPPGDASALAERLHTLLASPGLRSAMGAAGRRAVEERFSVEATRRAYLEKYDELIDRAAAPAGAEGSRAVGAAS